MKHLMRITVLAFIILIAIPATGCGSGFRVAEFPDENLDAAMRDILQFGEEDDVPVVRLEGLTTLDLSGTGISDISGLEDCINLVSLNLGSNNITDLNPLIRMSKLATLDLGDNRIANALPLQALFELRILDLSGNDIVDTSFLTKCEKLNSLDLSGNRIADIEAWIEYRPGAGQELTVELSDNPLNEESVKTFIPMMEKNGITIIRTQDSE